MRSTLLAVALAALIAVVLGNALPVDRPTPLTLA